MGRPAARLSILGRSDDMVGGDPGVIQRMVFRGRLLAFGLLGLGALAATSVRGADAPPSKDALDFFEAKIRPVFVDKCYNCHDGSGAKSVKGGFTLDTRAGLLKGGESGKPAIVPGDPAASPLI